MNRGKGMSFLKFWAIINVILGILVFLAALGLGIIATFFYTGNIDSLKAILPKGSDLDQLKMLLETNVNSVSEMASVHLPSWAKTILTQDIDIIVMGVSFGLASYVFSVNIIMTIKLLVNITKARDGIAEMSKFYAVFVSILSIIPLAIGIFMLIGCFAKKPSGFQSRARRRPYDARRGYARRRPYYRHR